MATASPPRPGLGIFWMLVTGACFVAVTALVKAVGSDVPAAQSGFLRYALGLVFLVPMIPALRRAPPRRKDLGLFAVRGAAHTLAVMLWFYAMTRIPIAEVTAMNYVNPIYVMLLGGLLLGEKLGARRLGAAAVAVLGTLLILRPGFREVDPGHVAMLFTAVAMAGSYFLAKLLSARASAPVIVTMLSIGCTLGLAPFAWAVWVPVGWSDLGLLFAVALFATAGHYTMTLAFSAAPLAVTQPVTFLQLVWATLLGWAVFDEGVDIWVVLGGVLIVGSVSFITWRETILNRRVTPAVDETRA